MPNILWKDRAAAKAPLLTKAKNRLSIRKIPMSTQPFRTIRSISPASIKAMSPRMIPNPFFKKCAALCRRTKLPKTNNVQNTQKATDNLPAVFFFFVV